MAFMLFKFEGYCECAPFGVQIFKFSPVWTKNLPKHPNFIVIVRKPQKGVFATLLLKSRAKMFERNSEISGQMCKMGKLWKCEETFKIIRIFEPFPTSWNFQRKKREKYLNWI